MREESEIDKNQRPAFKFAKFKINPRWYSYN